MSRWEEWKPIFTMIGIDVVFAAMNSMNKKVIDEGTNRLVLLTFQQLVAALFMAPVAYFTERKTRPKLTVEILVYLFFSALLGASLVNYFFFMGLQYTSATFACAFLNMTPVFTFLTAIPFRLERVNLRSKAGIAKAVGTVVCLAGAMLLSFYKGIALTNTSHKSAASKEHAGHSATGKWMLGTIALFAGSFSWASWFLLQTKFGEKYPALYSSTAIVFSFSFLQVVVLSLTTQRGLSIWVLKGKMEILTVLFAGIMGSGVGFLVMSWCVEKRGPVFAAAFSPLTQIMVAAIGVFILHEQLYLGSILGSIQVIAGLYFLLWGKSKDARSNSAVKPSQRNGEIHESIPTTTVCSIWPIKLVCYGASFLACRNCCITLK